MSPAPHREALAALAARAEAGRPRHGRGRVGEDGVPYGTGTDAAAAVARGERVLPPESLVTAAWLLGRVPADALPWPVLRAGRAGRGPGPDVREAALQLPSGVARTGDVEVHVRASDFVRHGHAADPAYAGVVLHVVWEDDRSPEEQGQPTPHAGGAAVTVAIGPAFRFEVRRLEAVVARGPSGAEPCAEVVTRCGVDGAAALVREAGRQRLAERAWRAARLAEARGWDGAWAFLLERALLATAGRVREDEARRAALTAGVAARLGVEPVTALAALARTGQPRVLVEALREAPPGGPRLGAARAAEVAWNAAVPLLAAMAAAYGDVSLARGTAALAAAWPTPGPYGRTRALAALAGPAPARPGALYAQGLLHLQDLWCTRGGCGQCPLSPALEGAEGAEA